MIIWSRWISALRRSISDRSWLTWAVCGSVFITGAFVIARARAAYASVEAFSSACRSLGEMHASMRVWELPPRACLSSRVSVESRYGT